MLKNSAFSKHWRPAGAAILLILAAAPRPVPAQDATSVASPAMTPIRLPLDPSVQLTPTASPALTPSPAAAPSPAPAPGASAISVLPPAAAVSTAATLPVAPVSSPAATPPPAQGPPLRTFQAGTLPQATQMHGSVVVAGRLYVLGGETLQGWTNAVISAPVGKDGKLGTWRKERELPERRAYLMNSVRARGDCIYIVGGLVPLTDNQPEYAAPSAREALWVRVASDGTLGEWKKSQPFLSPPGFYNVAAAVTETHLYAIGGFFLGAVSPAVYASPFSQDGTPGAWRQIATLPTPLWFHGTAVYDDRLYVWGGLTARTNQATNPKVFSADLRTDGSIGPWDEETPMPSPAYASAYTVIGDRLLGAAGRYQGGASTADVWSAPLVAGQLGHWEGQPSDLESRMYHSFGTDSEKGWLFITGGRNRTGTGTDKGHFIDAVQAFQVTGTNIGAAQPQ